MAAALDAAGSERQLLALAERLPRDRFEPEFVLISRRGIDADRALAAGIPTWVLPPSIRDGNPPLPVLAARVLRKGTSFVQLVRRRRYDVVDAWLFHAYVLAALARPVAQPPVLVIGRRSLAPREASGRAGRLLRRFAARVADAVVANSPQVRERALADEGLDDRKVRVIRNGVVIPTPTDDASRAALRARFGLPATALAIGTVANLLPGKGHTDLVEAAALVTRRHPSARFVFVGDGPLRASLQRRAVELGVAERITFAGSVPDAAAILSAFDVLVHPALAEGLPNAVLEGAAAGLAIVATPAGGTVEIVHDGETGILAPSRDAPALAAAIGRLADAPDLRARLGAAARERVAATFGMDRFVREFGDLYLELADRREARR